MLADRYEQRVEGKWREYWKERNIYAFNEQDEKKEVYSIDTPPPFTSGELHMGHVLSYSYFDFVARYKRMRGFNVYYPQGWDAQGFPTEVKVEQTYGRLPPVEFKQKCIQWSEECIRRMREQMDEMGFSPDWRYEYRTMDAEYHKKVQLSLIEMYKKKMVYRGRYPVYWCPKCVSAIAKAELEDVEKEGVLFYIKFTDEKGKEIVVATTRPELLPACVAILTHPEDQRYKWLSGKSAVTPLGKSVPVFTSRDVDKEFGTGVVMVCTFGDKMDVVWVHRYKLEMIECIDKYGRMINTGEFDGMKVEEAKTKIVEKLEREGKVVKKERIEQVIKVHDRCKATIELMPSMQWFVDIKNFGKEIKKMAHRIKWVPEFGITYLIDWVEGAEWDWVISRQRVFGTPMPFYYCEKCGATSSVEEKELPFYSEKAKERKCGCGSIMRPETSTCDCWVDSSITPLVISGWPDKKRMRRFYPNSLRPQGVEIVRTWAFYTIHRSGVCITGTEPWGTILLNGNVLAPDGKKMSKSLGNVITPDQLKKEYPIDAIRQWAAMSGAMAKDRPFSYEDIKYAKSFLTKLWNAARFVEIATVGYDGGKPKTFGVVDEWMLSQMNKLIKEFTTHMEKFEFHYAINKLHLFFWHDFCDRYIEYVKYRIYGDDEERRRAAQYVLREVVYNTIKLFAPISPYITEEIYHEIFKAQDGPSIHNTPWPRGGEIRERILKSMEMFNAIISTVRQHKAKNKLPQNMEIEKIILTIHETYPEELLDEIKAIGKIKNILVNKVVKKGTFKVEF